MKTSVTITDPTAPVVDLFNLVEMYLCYDFKEFICHGTLHEWSASYFAMPGQNSKCRSYDKPKETLVNECNSCEQWLPYCHACVSGGDDVEFESVPFYCSQCLSTDRHITLKTQLNATTVIANQAQWEKRQSSVQNVIGHFSFPVWKSQKTMPNYFLVIIATLASLSLTHHILQEPKPQALPWLTPLHLVPIFNP